MFYSGDSYFSGGRNYMTKSLKVLVVEDDLNVRLGCCQALELEDIDTIEATSAEQAQKLIKAGFHGVILTDIRLPGEDGVALMRRLFEQSTDMPVILMTGHGDVTLAVQAMKSGAYDFIEKPFTSDYLVEVVRRALDKYRLSLEVRELRTQLRHRSAIDARILGNSPPMQRVRYLIEELGDSAADILIHGETGTGKEIVALALHDTSPYSGGHFVTINCGGIPESLFDSEVFGHEAGAFTGAGKRRIGKVEYANAGTLFLDEIESMPMVMQVKLLRVLQERCIERLGSNTSIPVDFRVIAATKEDLCLLVEQGKFRADLYYRLSVAELFLPPLRERREDIGLLFEHFSLQASARHKRSPLPLDTVRLHRLMAWSWPGNVRELHNVANRYVLGVGSDFSTDTMITAQPLSQIVEAFERALIIDALFRNDANLTRTSEDLLIPKTTLHDKVRKYGL